MAMATVAGREENPLSRPEPIKADQGESRLDRMWSTLCRAGWRPPSDRRKPQTGSAGTEL